MKLLFKNIFRYRLTLVLVTSLITFTVTAGIFIFWNYFNPHYVILPESADVKYYKPEYAISFDPCKVNLETLKKYKKVRDILNQQYYKKIDENTLIEGAIAGMADSLNDNYTVYFDKENMKLFTEKFEGAYVGIGVSITVDDNGLLTVVEPFNDSPAKKAGIKKDDRIIKVNDKDVTKISDERLVVKMIQGKEDTEIGITVYRPSEGKNINFKVKRERIKISNIESRLLDNNIGYIKLSMFDEEISSFFNSHLNNLLTQGIKGLVIDVRDNPGGDYEQVVNIVDRLLPEGLIVYTEDRDGRKTVENSDEIELKLPIAVLVNQNSASASEVLAGALKDNKKGILVGTQTFGKGLVQVIAPLGDGSGLKFTIARYFTPSGVCIQGKGIYPDIVAKPIEKYKDVPASQIPYEEDIQLKKAVDVIKDKLK